VNKKDALIVVKHNI